MRCRWRRRRGDRRNRQAAISPERSLASRPKITGRLTSLAAAFVHAIIPRRVDKDAQAKLYKQFSIDSAKCVYCGREATDSDHFRAIVKSGKPSGYFHTIDNIVPSCGPCNQSKSGADWKLWMSGKAKGSPNKKGVADLSKRIDMLSRFAASANAIHLSEADLRNAVGADLWDGYWRRLDAIKGHLNDAQAEAEKIRGILETEYDQRSQEKLNRKS
jgi:5-methylcytosine-specific restriction endonuclease McrA